MIKTAVAIAMSFPILIGSLFGSQVLRTIHTGDESEANGLRLLKQDAKFQLGIKVTEEPVSLMDITGNNEAWVFQFLLENNSGVEIRPQDLQENDILLEPLRTVEGIQLIESGKAISSKDLPYLYASSFRTMYNSSGEMIESFEVGQVLDAYKFENNPSGGIELLESGFQTIDGIEIIPNGTEVEEKHLAMLEHQVVMPVHIRAPIQLELECYLRMDWPEKTPSTKNKFWVTRVGEQFPIQLYSYQLQIGDIPMENITTEDGTKVCIADKALKEKGEFNSLEAIDKHDVLYMLLDGKEITSIDPISHSRNTTVCEPGQLVVAAQNDREVTREFYVKDDTELDTLLSESIFSYARKYGSSSDDPYPYPIYFTHYITPYEMECREGCDNVLEISDVQISGETKCDKCKKNIKIPPKVRQSIPSFSYTDEVWSKKLINCGYCNNNFYRKNAHSLAGPEDQGFEYPPLSTRAIHPSRLRSYRLHANVALAKPVIYYKNGEEIIIEAGTPIDDELRGTLEDRATSPIYIAEPKKEHLEAAQCPHCFGWNTRPIDAVQMRSEMDVDEIRKGIICFKQAPHRVNKLELVIFGLTDKKEPTSGRSLAYTVTYRRISDEHFKHLKNWTKDKEEWKYLPRYAHEKAYTIPVSIDGSYGESADDEEEDF
ncbi:MAG: hypothetical protein HQL32_08945 [Planctomycetes bacterium]|nr:hypothetical protein [Planctomycetota bacterium]